MNFAPPPEAPRFNIPTRKRNADAAPLMVEVVRALSNDDLDAIMGIQRGDQGGLNLSPIQRVKHIHHRTAMYVAMGKPDAEISLLTGYTPQRIRDLKVDPTFAELVGYYSTQVDIEFKNTLERLNTIGIGALDELQERLEQKPESWPIKDLMALAQMAIVDPLTKSTKAAQAAAEVTVDGKAPGVQVNIQFVTSANAGTRPQIEGDLEDRLIDVSPKRGED